jgi:N-acetylmuramoyl-L-alanine amidase
MSSFRTDGIGGPRRHGHRAIGVVLFVAVASLVAVSGPAFAGQTGQAGQAGATTSQAAAEATTTAARPVLRLGSTGATVTYLQQRLAALHYDVGPIDGQFGSSTFHAVVAFQKVNNLVRDGVVGALTWARLDSPLVPRPRYSHTGTWVEVRLDKQVLFLARSGAVVRIVDASTGKASTPTPSGNFSIYRRIDGWRTSDLGTLWRPNYFYGGYAIHGYSSVPNYPASHGCVRVTIAAMNRLWPVLGIGMPVHVYYRT